MDPWKLELFFRRPENPPLLGLKILKRTRKYIYFNFNIKVLSAFVVVVHYNRESNIWLGPLMNLVEVFFVLVF